MAPYWSPSDDCKVGCGQPSRAKGSYLCERHFRLLHRQDAKRKKHGWKVNHEVRFRAMQTQWNEKIGGFECHLTKVKLSDDQFSPLRASWEHLKPGNEKTAVLAAAIFNHMKSDLTENEFRDVVTELARYFAKPNAVFDTTVLPKRPFRPKALS
jgi:hypothetical protein